MRGREKKRERERAEQDAQPPGKGWVSAQPPGQSLAHSLTISKEETNKRILSNSAIREEAETEDKVSPRGNQVYSFRGVGLGPARGRGASERAHLRLSSDAGARLAQP
ncbi:hypothetical protein EYF80_004658 [Liparis tanakae]|uniref:Uncharacterized protein n=1 Tax=Liparis tanakae TaxID=230148 RepID=A0A4Z2J539_9TELE|nr:hypothetical protein EYF80_004658 [Liparis tanakae]